MGKHKHIFGGNWTTLKLNMVQEYLQFYVKALKKQYFNLIYMDAFAGTGYLDALDSKEQLLFDIPDLRKSLSGSAQNALKIDPPFNRYIFIDKDPEHCAELQQMIQAFPNISSRVSIETEESNVYLRNFCRTKIGNFDRVVLFLDPYGLQVKWDTIKAIAATHRIDMWYLFPLGVATNRLLRKNAQVHDSEREKLNALFGETKWYYEFYHQIEQEDLFGKKQMIATKCERTYIADYFCKRLKTVFAGVADDYRLLYNTKNNPLFVLYFAVGNPSPKAINLAMSGAKSILED